MIRKKKNVIAGKRVQKIPGLKIVLTSGVSARTKKKAVALGKKEVAEKERAKARTPSIARYEAQIAEAIGKRTFTVGPLAHRSTRYYINGKGKRLIITRGTPKGKKTPVEDLAEFNSVIKQLAHKLRL